MSYAKRILAKGANVPAVRKCWNLVVRLPIVGKVLHGIARYILPPGQRLWVLIRYGEYPQASGWHTIEPRYEGGHYGTHEPCVQKLLVACLKLGYCFYDIGAHTGFFSILAAVLVGRNGAVVAVEPDRRNASLLRETVARNRFGPNVAVVECALSSFEGAGKFASAISGPNSNTGMSKMVDHDLLGSYEVSCMTMDKLAETFTAPNVIKMDVEGTESEVLKGAIRIFETVRPVLICEVHDELNATFVGKWLGDRSYAVRWLTHTQTFPRQLIAWPAERKESGFAKEPQSSD
jgi:FkbM family methyltransferase